MHSISNEEGYALSTQRPTSARASASQLMQWHPEPLASHKPPRNLPGRGRPRRISRDIRDIRDISLLQSNRESMEALSDFLKNKEPPSHNLMSIPDSLESSVDSKRRSTLPFFRRRRTKKDKGPRLIRLPDSAVAGRTRAGFRYIAISIPIEFDHLECASTPEHLTSRIISESELLAEDPDIGSVSISKPNDVKVRRPDPPFLLSAAPKGRNKYIQNEKRRGQYIPTNPGELGLPEITKPWINCSEDSSTKLESPAETRSFGTVRTTNLSLQTTRESDNRNSGGTTYSAVSLATRPGHSRGASSVSTAPSINPTTFLKSGVPSRQSSAFNIPEPLCIEPVHLANVIAVRTPDEPPLSSILSLKSAADSITSFQSSPVFGTAETARSYHTAGVVGFQRFEESNITPSCPPNRSLPSLPNSAKALGSRTSKASPVVGLTPAPKLPLNDVTDNLQNSGRNNAANSMPDIRQTREERVRARKRRDVAAARANIDSRRQSPEANRASKLVYCSSPLAARGTIEPRISKERSATREIADGSANTVAPIKVVADIIPSTNAVLSHGLPAELSRFSEKEDSKNAKQGSLKGRHPPLRSSASSVYSDSDSSQQLGNTSFVTSPQRLPIKNELDARRQERRLKRNRSVRDRELDARLEKIERDNAMMLRAFHGISNSFAEFRQVCPKMLVQRSNSGLSTAGVTGAGCERESGMIEPLMRRVIGECTEG